ncbi:VWA domain-containing protein [bacterium]|nr:VWA domain-containing protein [bacterium]
MTYIQPTHPVIFVSPAVLKVYFMSGEIVQKQKEALLKKIAEHKSLAKPILDKARKTTPLEVVFMFDTTGSMDIYLSEVQVNVQLIIREIRKRVPDARISVIVYKDHEQGPYVTKTLAFSEKEEEITAFLRSPDIMPGAGGGGAEAVECALYEANQLDWTKGPKGKAIILIGDKPPHGVMDSFDDCLSGRDYRIETDKLVEKNVKIYTVLCNNVTETIKNFQFLAEKTGGKFVTLEAIHDLVDLIVAVSIKESNPLLLQAYTDELRKKGVLTDSKRKLLQGIS